MNFTRKDSCFYSEGTRCAGWLFLPQGVENPAVVIMAHGLAAERKFRLPAFAERFVQRGLAVFLFDYRNFGDSQGTPRNLVSPRRHVKDWQAAIAHVRGLPEIDPQRLALWGTSFSGGHVIVTAAGDHGIRAVVSQVPFVDSITGTSGLGIKQAFKAISAGLRDLLRIITGRSPYYIPVVGEPDTFAVMNSPDAYSGYMTIVPGDSSWRNECPARIAFSVLWYRPIRVVAEVRCPLLIVMAENDSLIPAEAVRRMASKARDSSLVSLPLGHFDVYVGEGFEETVTKEADFLEKCLN